MKVFVLAAFLAMALANDLPYPNPAHPSAAYPKASYDYPPRNYEFEYVVKDEPSYNDFGHKEKADAKIVSGVYFVNLPDGRLEKVTYTVDEYGYHPKVEITGEIKPAYKSSYPAPPAYSKPTYPAHIPHLP